MIQRTTEKGFGPIVVGMLDRIFRRTILADAIPIKAQMPFANDSRGITLLAQHQRQCKLIFLKHRAIERIRNVMKFTPMIATREHRIARWRADSRGAVTIGKAHAFLGQLIEMGRGDFRVGIVRTEIAKTHVIGIKNDDIGLH